MAQSDPQFGQFGPYELVQRLGVGGMAETFLAIRRGPGGFEQRVCLKRILPPFELDPEFVRLFLEEARVSARLRHVNIAQVIDFGVVQGAHFLTLELIEGMDLRALLQMLGRRDETMAPELASYLAFELAGGLDFAHSSEGGIVHRDVSPSNVLLSRVGEIKLADFGIAKAISQPGVTRSGVVKGKVPYMAPEYARKGLFDARSDLFSMGVTLYEALAGHRPFDGITDLDTIERSTNGAHVPLADIAKGAPPTLIAAIERCIAPQPEDRFQSAADFLDALVSVAPPPTARRTMGELVRRVAQVSEIERPPTEEIDVHGETVQATPRGTIVLGNAGRKVAADVHAASAGDATKTRTPSRRAEALSSLDASQAVAPDAAASAVPLISTGEHYDTDIESRAQVPARSRTLWIAAAFLALASAGTVFYFAAPPRQRSEPRSAAPTAATPHAIKPPIHTTPNVPASGQSQVATPLPTTSVNTPRALDDVQDDAARNEVPSVTASERPTRRTEAPSAYIEVAVVPFGDVWLNGRNVGQSPVTLRVPPGRHTVAAGESRPERSESVRMQAGQKRKIVIRR